MRTNEEISMCADLGIALDKASVSPDTAQDFLERFFHGYAKYFGKPLPEDIQVNLIVAIIGVDRGW